MKFLSQDATVMLEKAYKSRKPDDYNVYITEKLEDTVDGLLTCLS
jgi:hypothetical protein